MPLLPSPPWEHRSPWSSSLSWRPPHEHEAPSGRWDVIVVGAGLTGLVTAMVLHRAGAEVCVLDRHGIGGVTSRGSTGKLTALQGDRYSTILRHRGSEVAASYAEAALLGVGGLVRLIEDEGITCGLTETTDHVYATEPDGAERCRLEMAAAASAGLPVTWAEDLELPFPTIGAVTLERQAHLDPGALCAGLAQRLDGRVRTGCPVTGVHESGDGVVVTLAWGEELRADHAIVATLGPIHDPALLSTRCAPMRSYAIAAPHGSAPDGTFISLDEVPRSIRPAALDAPSVVVAGEGHVAGEDGGRTSEERWAALEAYAAEVLGAGSASHRWVAHDLVPSDGVPFIGRSDRHATRTWVATGFQKWGISTAMVAADLLLGALDGRPRPWADAFDPGRLAASLTVRTTRDVVRTVRHAVVDRVGDALPGHQRRPRCTHLGCVLAFDESEQTWDCPCHGSRFDAAGHVIAGPATEDLDPGDLPGPS